jgi:hypothetical protein
MMFPLAFSDGLARGLERIARAAAGSPFVQQVRII